MSKTYIAHEILGGIYENTVKMTVDRRLRYAPYSQAGWIDGQNTFRFNYNLELMDLHKFFSYSSLIFYAVTDKKGRCCYISNGGAGASIDCSRTTSRQSTLALRELGLSDRVLTALKSFLSGGEDRAALYDGCNWLDILSGEVIA